MAEHLAYQLRWTEEAADDLERITDYLFESAPGRAAELVREIYDAPSALLTFPYRGRPGRKSDTRELVLSPLPYIVVYEIIGRVIQVARILHGARQWPSKHSARSAGADRRVISMRCGQPGTRECLAGWRKGPAHRAPWPREPHKNAQLVRRFRV